MGIENIRDSRKHPYRWKKVNAIVEPTWHDNTVKESDRCPRTAGDDRDLGYAEREHLSLAAALAWAQGFAHPVTLFLYDKDDGIYAKPVPKRGRTTAVKPERFVGKAVFVVKPKRKTVTAKKKAKAR